MKKFHNVTIPLIFFLFFLWLPLNFFPKGPDKSKPPFITYFLIDGLSQSVFQNEIKKNNLPNIKALLDKGIYVINGISSFPSMTGYALYPFLTGIDAVESGILGLRWVNRALGWNNLRNYVGGKRSIYMNKDIFLRPKTIYEHFPDQLTVSINSYMNRGAKKKIMTGYSHLTSKFQNTWVIQKINGIPIIGDFLAPNVYQTETFVMKSSMEDLENKPKIHWITFTTPDSYQHINGMDHNYTKILRHIDSLIGKYIQRSKELGQDGDRIYAVVSDHGVQDVRKNIDPGDHFLRKFDLQFYWGNSINLFNKDMSPYLKEASNIDGLLALNGNLMSFLYLKNPFETYPKNWKEKLPYEILRKYPINSKTSQDKKNKYVDIVKEIISLKGIEFVIYQRSKGEIVIHSRKGIGIIKDNAQKYQYNYKQNDPLKYSEYKKTRRLISKGFYSSIEWLRASYESEYPDAIYRIAKLLQHPKSGDLVIIASQGYDMGKNYEIIVKNFKGGHGSLHADSMRVPYIIAGKGIPRQKIEFARAEDVGKYLIDKLLYAKYPSQNLKLR